MIPQLVTVRHGDRRFFVPVLPVVLVLAPLLVLALLGGLVACVVLRVDPAGALTGLGRLLWALPGTRFEIEDGATTVHVHIR